DLCLVLDKCQSSCKYFLYCLLFFFFSSRRRHTRLQGDWSSDVCSSDLQQVKMANGRPALQGGPAIGHLDLLGVRDLPLRLALHEIGRASCREKCRSRWWAG